MNKKLIFSLLSCLLLLSLGLFTACDGNTPAGTEAGDTSPATREPMAEATQPVTQPAPEDTDAAPGTEAVTEAPTEEATTEEVTTEAETDDGIPLNSLTIGGVDIKEYTLVVQDGGADCVRDSADELIEFIEKATGGFRIPEKASDHEIVIGITDRDTDRVKAARDAVKLDGYTLLMDGGRLYITGSCDRGTMYGVYCFLEDYIGVRFLARDTTVVIDQDAVAIPADVHTTHNPVFEMRDTYWYDMRYDQTTANHAKDNSFYDSSTPVSDIGGGIGYAGRFVHTINLLQDLPYQGNVQPCLTDEKTSENVRKNVRRVLEENPTATIVSVSQVDSYPDQLGCQCERCKAIDDSEGTPMGSLLSFVNRIADDIKDDYPHVYVDTLAYRYTRKAPKTIVPRDNVIIRLCSIECCFCHPLDDPNCPHNVEFKKDIEEWAAICNNLYIWDYTTDFLCYLSPFPNFAVLQKNVKFFKDHHVIGMFEQGNYQSLSGEFGELRGYLLAKLLWNPDMTEEEYYALMDEFLRDYYGAGWQYIREYIDVTSKKAAERHLFIYDTPNRIFPFEKKDAEDPNLDILDPEKIEAWSRDVKNSPALAITEETAFAEYLLGLWNKALAAAECDEHHAHVMQSSVQALYYAEFVLPAERFESLNIPMLDAIRASGITRFRETADIPNLNNPEAYPDLR